ncbi:MAG: DUF4065 domain-containing protein [Bifidobacteriaceae bacterium]|jgi:uncharacterized phage-associated protein|nr:DUF4065 domain-containing protein [Bifidobacteriaceae bacterium]
MKMFDAQDVQFTHHVDPLAAAAFFVRADQLRDEPDLTPMKLQKLLYLAQGNYLASTGQRLFDADVEAFEHGPVVHQVWREFSGRQIINPEQHAQVMTLDVPADIAEFLEDVWLRYQDWSASALRRLTHSQAPWRDCYVEGAPRNVIPDGAMTTYFGGSVPAEERVFHPRVVVVPSSVFDDDPVADARLEAFLRA